jgi:hypothetical protein
MNKQSWQEELETRPATPNQLGRIMHHFERLGWHDTYSPYHRSQLSEWWNERYRSEREVRLGICSKMIGREITSVRDLTLGEAGKIIRALADCKTYDELVASAALEKSP